MMQHIFQMRKHYGPPTPRIPARVCNSKQSVVLTDLMVGEWRRNRENHPNVCRKCVKITADAYLPDDIREGYVVPKGGRVW